MWPIRSAIIILGTAIVIAFLPTACALTRSNDGRVDRLTAARACAAEADHDRKLAHNEIATGTLVVAVDDSDIGLVEGAIREKTRRGLFGFSLGRLFGGDDEKGGDESKLAELQTLVSTIAEVRQIDRKTYQLRIQEADALWQINEAPSRFINPQVGETVGYKRAAMAKLCHPRRQADRVKRNGLTRLAAICCENATVRRRTGCIVSQFVARRLRLGACWLLVVRLSRRFNHRGSPNA